MTALGALGSRLEERLTTHAATVGVVDKAAVGDIRAHRLEAVAWEQADLGAYDLLDTRYATGALGEFPHVVRL